MHISVSCFQETLDVASHNVYNMHMTGRIRLELGALRQVE